VFVTEKEMHARATQISAAAIGIASGVQAHTQTLKNAAASPFYSQPHIHQYNKWSAAGEISMDHQNSSALTLPVLISCCCASTSTHSEEYYDQLEN
jgi:hypothetical protein